MMCLLQVCEPPAHERRRCGLEASPCKDSAFKKSLSLVCGETSYSMNFNMWWNILIGYINFLDIIYLYHNLFYTKKIHQSRVHLIQNGQVFSKKRTVFAIGIGCKLGGVGRFLRLLRYTTANHILTKSRRLNHLYEENLSINFVGGAGGGYNRLFPL